MTKLKIKVTKEILERSKYCGVNSHSSMNTNCAIALAVRDIFPNAVVEDNGIFLSNIGWRERLQYGDFDILLPQVAKNFIAKFDSGTRYSRPLMDEIEFEVKIPDTVIEQINIDEIKPLLENHPTLELITQ